MVLKIGWRVVSDDRISGRNSELAKNLYVPGSLASREFVRAQKMKGSHLLLSF